MDGSSGGDKKSADSTWFDRLEAEIGSWFAMASINPMLADHGKNNQTNHSASASPSSHPTTFSSDKSMASPVDDDALLSHNYGRVGMVSGSVWFLLTTTATSESSTGNRRELLACGENHIRCAQCQTL